MVPSPTGGWNTRDAPTAMALNDAVSLINQIPRHGFVEMRGGYEEHSDCEKNTAAQADGTNYLQGGDWSEVDFGTGDFSIEYWTQHTGTSDNDQRFIVKRNGAAEGWEVRQGYGSNEVAFIIEDTSTNEVVCLTTGDALPDDSAWHHVAITVDRTANEVNIYVDATLAGGSPFDISSVTGTVTNASNFNVFATSAGASVHVSGGLIDDLRMWSDVRTAAEITANMNTELTGSETGLVGYWRMNGHTGASITTIADDSANSNTLTDTGGGDLVYASNASIDAIADIDLCVEFFDGSTRALITASATQIYDSTAAGTATSLGSGFTNGRWDTAMMDGIMAFVNGDDTPQQYNGSALSTLTITGSGLTSSDLVGVHVHKRRSYFWEANSQSFWYAAINTLGGALTEFPLGEVAEKGGKLLRMETWTVDGGSGPDDYAVFIMSSGEVIVYQGDNPGSAISWGLVGIYDIGEPASDRAITRYGPQLMVCVENDVIALPSAFQQPTPPTTKLSGAIADAVTNYGGNFGWELFWFPNESLMILNVPVAVSPDSFEQYILNTQTMAGARFTGIPARTWCTYNEQAYFGSSNGAVYRFNTVQNDDGSDIDTTALMAWNDYGTPTNKMVTAVRPRFSAVDSLSYDIRAGYSFTEPTTSSPSSTVSDGTPWGSAWGSSWGATTGETIIYSWRATSGRGSPVALKLQYSRQGDKPKWYGTDILVRGEGNL